MGGVFHTSVNVGFIQWMHSRHPNAHLYFYAECSHVANCMKRTKNQHINYRKFPFSFPINKFTLIIRDLSGCLYVICVLFHANKQDIIFITNLLPLTHWCAYVLNKFAHRNLHIALHGQLEAILPDSTLGLTGPYFKLHGYILRQDRQNRYVVLGTPVYEAIKNHLGIDTQVIIMDHPYAPVTRESFTSFPKTPLRLGQIGVGNRGKGTENLFRLGELLCNEIEENKLELHLVGRLDRALRKQANRWVKWHKKPLTEDEYSLNINELDYVLFLRNSNTGRATPSGSFFDAISHGKPYIALRHPYIIYYNNSIPCSGTICESVEEMADEIRKILLMC